MKKGLMTACLIAGLLTGCGTAMEKPAGYFGPTESLAAVTASINRNAEAIPTLFAHHYLEANIKDPETGKTHFVNASGYLMVRKPHELFLRAKKDPVPVFELGSTEDRYWLTVLIDPARHWWGYHKNAGDPCVARKIPIRPDLLGEVLGIGGVGGSLLELPAPTLRFNNDYDCYMLTWHDEVGDHWIARKEIWYDRKTLTARKVLLFDGDGRVIVRANLGKYVQIDAKDGVADIKPWVATDFDLFFPESQSTMKIQLTDVALTSSNGNPKAGTIVFPEEPDVPPENRIKIDCN
jgi:hypothetical protein